MLTSKKTPKPTVLALCEGIPLVTGGFPSQRASNAESVCMSWRHYEAMMSVSEAALLDMDEMI